MTDEVRLSPRSSVLSPVSKLHKLRELQAEAQQKRVDAFAEKQRRWKKPSQKPTIEIARRIYPQKPIDKPKFHFRRTYARENASEEKKNERANEDLPAEKLVENNAALNDQRSIEQMNEPRRFPRKLQLETWEEVKAKAHARAVKKAELLRSQQLLEEIEMIEKARGIKTVKTLDTQHEDKEPEDEANVEKIVPSTNYHLKHLGLAKKKINIYAPFDATKNSTSNLNGKETLGQRRVKIDAEPKKKVAEEAIENTDQLHRRKKHSSSSRSTPIKSRLRSYNASPSSSYFDTDEIPMSFIGLGLGSVAIFTFGLSYWNDVKLLLPSWPSTLRPASALSILFEIVRYFALHPYQLILFIVIFFIAIALILSGPSSTIEEEQLKQKLIVCAKEELLLHAKSNIRGHTAVREVYLQEAILDLLSLKGDAREHAEDLWPDVLAALLKDSRVRRFRAKVKVQRSEPLYLWEWIAPHSATAMNEYTARITAHRNES